MNKNVRTAQLATAVLAVAGVAIGLLATTASTPRHAAGRAASAAAALAASNDAAHGSAPADHRGGTLRSPVWGHQGRLRTLRPGSVPAHRPGSALTPQGIVGNDPDDPEESGCWDANAYIANTASFPFGYVANWYSPDCGTNWAETVVTNDPGISGEFLHAQIIDMKTGEAYAYESFANGTYTDMTQSEYDQACAFGGLVADGSEYYTSSPGACA